MISQRSEALVEFHSGASDESEDAADNAPPPTPRLPLPRRPEEAEDLPLLREAGVAEPFDFRG